MHIGGNVHELCSTLFGHSQCQAMADLGCTPVPNVLLGLIKKSRLGTFNLPCHHAGSKQIIKAIFQEGSFEIRRLEIIKTAWDGGTDDEDERASNKNRTRGKFMVKYIRAVLKALLVTGFGEGVLDELFGRASVEFTELMNAQDCQFCLANKKLGVMHTR
uniref:Uncharacterized protein n=1 Tax=Kalanchoe fedtschenkoi TaxID=63787 RepID=A0A7N0T802_KALFE